MGNSQTEARQSCCPPGLLSTPGPACTLGHTGTEGLMHGCALG